MQRKCSEMELSSREEIGFVEIRQSSPEGTWKPFERMEKNVVENMVDQTHQADYHNRDEEML